MNKFVSLGLGAAAVVVALVVGTQILGPTDPSGVGGVPPATPSPTTAPSAAATPVEVTPTPTAERSVPPSATPVGGTVEYQMDGGPATTDVDAIADGTSVWGTAVTTISAGTHTVGLECAADYGDTWAFGGTLEQSTLPGERAGLDWSVVLVKKGSPQQIAIVFSIEKSAGEDCDGWLGGFSGWDPSALSPVESGELVPPPDLAP